MKINIKNTNALSAEIAKIEGKSKKRTMTASRLTELIKKLEYTLSIIAPKKEWVGSEFTLTTGTTVVSSYFGVAMATFVSIKRFPSGWFVTDVERLPIKSRDIYPVKLPKLSEPGLHRINIFN